MSARDASRAPFEAYALTFEPLLEERVWGGARLGRRRPSKSSAAPIGESWEISDVEGKASVIARGAYAGTSLRTLLERHAESILGKRGAPVHPAGGPQFPLLIKLLDAKQDLSVQVHPSDGDLRSSGSPGSGKTEAWIILDAQKKSRILHGLPAKASKAALYDRMEELRGRALPDAEAKRLFREVAVERGDVVFVPAGTIHAVGKEILLLEIQQTSDITYRIYDWGRAGTDGKPRDLHLSQAKSVSDAEPVPCPFARLSGAPAMEGFGRLVDCAHFRIEAATVAPRGPAGELRSNTFGPAGPEFHILAGFEGRALCAPSRGEPVELVPESFALLPAALGDYTLTAVGTEPARVLRFLAGEA
jgi:mannose-6-phosphate isomerase class I